MPLKRVGEWLEINIPKDWAYATVFSILSSKLGASKSLIQRWNQASAIKKNNSIADVNHKLEHNDRLYLHLFKKEDYGVLPENTTVDILYEDDHLLIVNKPPGMDTHPNEPNQKGTLANAIAFYYQLNGLQIRVRHIHRLDRDTSGAVIFAKHDLAQSILDQDLQVKKIKRTYLAIIKGKLSKLTGTIDKPIGRDRHHATRRRVSPNGQKAITHYKVERYDPKTNLSILSLQLDTGRTHQIRVHLSSMNHPIIGDTLYGGSKDLIKRQALHAKSIALSHPLTHEKVEVEASIPADILAIIKSKQSRP
ncbi:RluA family pseudouridine synthase [Metabacillus schmidteae]|uniref:RluA family pseudouridine synthase n=1 Tax=Metabacillus schmidteae TaxID=2730405 RepID=UPI00158DC735|nr:RluA family pseudouridine synthase [Metabacillus schmidteae]